LFIKKPEIHTGNKIASSTDGAGQTGCLHVEEYRRSVDPYPSLFTKQNKTKPKQTFPILWAATLFE